MRVLFILLFYYSICSTQTTINNDYIYNLNIYNCFELNNLGDPLINFNHSSISDLKINHYAQKTRLIDHFVGFNNVYPDSIFSSIAYQSSYNEGGLVSSLLSRPLNDFFDFKFSLINLSSEGFFQNQKNKYNNIFFNVDYFNINQMYSFSISLLSNNGNYNYNGGIEEYNNNASIDLLNTLLSNPSATIKNRSVNFIHKLNFINGSVLKHSFVYVLFNRSYQDVSPTSYLYDGMYSDNSSYYENNSLFRNYINKISFIKNTFNLDLSYYLYYTNSTNVDKFEDIIISSKYQFRINNSNYLLFNIHHCLAGHSSNNYSLKFTYINDTNFTQNKIQLSSSRKKSDFFNDFTNSSYSLDWIDLNSYHVLESSISSFFHDRYLSLSTYFNVYQNYFYINSNFQPIQHIDPINHFGLELNKQWYINNWCIENILTFQYSTSDFYSVPLVFNYNKLSYETKLLDNISIKSSFTSRFFTNYYTPLFFPLFDVFYNQTNEVSGFKNFLSFELFLIRNQFNIGFLIDNIQNIFIDNYFLVPNYYYGPSVLRLSLKWNFFN